MKKSLESQLAAAICEHRSPRASIALALSGGMDSMLLAECFCRLQIPFTALHFNHRWRGRQSDQDAAWIQRWCKTRKIPIILGNAEHTGPASENAARIARWNFFQNAADTQNLRELWLAHHADDLVETFLMQLLRGAGPEGLTSLRKERMRNALRIVRPWLDFFKNQLQQQAVSWKLRWREDVSNRNLDYFRNRVRAQLIPIMSKLARRDIRPQLRRAATILADENAYWEQQLPKRWQPRPSVADLKKLSVAAQRRWLRGWLQSQNIGDLSFDDIEAVRRLLAAPKPAKINLSKNQYCRRRAGVLFIDA